MTKPLVSIIMPAYNSGKLISESIDSVLCQSYDNIELLIIDDGSTDDTTIIVNCYIQNDKRIKLLHNKGKGVSSARNCGIKNALGAYICFLDSDDIYSNNAIELRLEYLRNHPNVDAAFCEVRLTDQKLKELGWVITGKPVVTFEDFYNNAVHTASVLFKSDIIKRIGFDESFSNGEDWLCWHRIARMGVEYHYVHGCFVLYRQHNSTVLSNFKYHENQLLRVIDIIYGMDPGCPNPDPRYSSGLTKPSKLILITQRRIRLFFFLLMKYNFQDAEEIGNELMNYDLTKINTNDLVSSLKISTVRAELCHMNDWEVKFNSKRKKIEPFLKRYLPNDKLTDMLNKIEKPSFTQRIKAYIKSIVLNRNN